MLALKLLPVLFASLSGSSSFGQLLQHLCCCLLKTGRPAIESADGAAASQERWRRGSTHTCLSCSQAWVGVWCFLGEEKLDSHIWRTFRCWWSVLLGEALISLFENRCFLPWQAVSSGTFLALTANLKRPLQLQDWESNMPQLQMSWIEVFKDNQACLIAFSTTIVLLHEISDSAVPTVTKENFKMYRFASSGFDLFYEALYCWNTSPN